MLFYGTKSGLLVKSFIDKNQIGIKQSDKINLKNEICLISIINKKSLLVTTKSRINGIYQIDINSFKIITNYKTYHEHIKKIAHYDSTHFLAITNQDKLMLYDSKRQVPKKSFKINTKDIIDVIMPN